MAQKNSTIALNFFPLDCQEFNFVVYRKKVLNNQEPRPFEDCFRWNLPDEDNENKPYISYWVCYEPKEGFEEFICEQSTNNDLTNNYLLYSLKLNCKDLKSNEVEIDKREFSRRIYFIIQEQPNNRRETVWLEPYLLRETNEFGFLCDFALYSPPNEKQNKRDLELSLTHKKGKQNKDFYIDRFEKLKIFIFLEF